MIHWCRLRACAVTRADARRPGSGRTSVSPLSLVALDSFALHRLLNSAQAPTQAVLARNLQAEPAIAMGLKRPGGMLDPRWAPRGPAGYRGRCRAGALLPAGRDGDAATSSGFGYGAVELLWPGASRCRRSSRRLRKAENRLIPGLISGPRGKGHLDRTSSGPLA